MKWAILETLDIKLRIIKVFGLQGLNQLLMLL